MSVVPLRSSVRHLHMLSAVLSVRTAFDGHVSTVGIKDLPNDFERAQPGVNVCLQASEPGQASGRQQMFDANAWLAAIVESSSDAILSKTLEGVILSWNRGAERLFGYTADEAVGLPITIIIPPDRIHEEDTILSKIRIGERIEHFETVRRRKDGTLIDISLTVSPIRDANGKILGASKIARDISATKRLVEQQNLLLREMHHRVKNLFAVTQGLISLSARGATSAAELAQNLTTRVSSLARAHSLTLVSLENDANIDSTTALKALLEAILAPYDDGETSRIQCSGCDIPIKQRALLSLALLLHELTTNAAKYGGLASPDGRLLIDLKIEDAKLKLMWAESGAPPRAGNLNTDGFGSKLAKASLQNLRGELQREWRPDGVLISLTIPLAELSPS